MGCRRNTWFVFLAVMAGWLGASFVDGSRGTIVAQDTTAESAAGTFSQQDPAKAIASDQQIEGWIEMLGSNKFAIRERAAMKIIAAGDTVVPRLQQLAVSAADPETRLRAGELVRQITRGNQEARFESFLAGTSDRLEGWASARLVLGRDSGPTRELYVEIFRSHPEVPASLTGRQEDRAVAMNTVAARVRKARIEQRRFETRADAVALLLPLAYDRDTLTSEYEQLLIRTLSGTAGTELYKDPTLTVPYRNLVARWALRSGIDSRRDLLWLMMRHDVATAGDLAMRTLARTNDPETVTCALQAIARFGDRRIADSIMSLVDDDRVVVPNGFVRGNPSRTELGDVAMATVAILYDIPLAEVGFDGATKDPKFGFRPEEVGFEMRDRKKRNAARQKLIIKVTEKKIGKKKQGSEPLLVD